MSAPVVRAATAEDWPALVALNNTEIPKVGPLSRSDGEWFLANGEVLVIDGGDGDDGGPGEPTALLVLLAEGCGYASPNYSWFADRYERFQYVDRIVVRADRVGTGVGRALYRLAIDRAIAAGRSMLAAEVNLVPRNDGSLAFHRRIGFRQVGQHVDPRNGQTEAMLVLSVGDGAVTPATV
ncbi:MAG: GNAT family N-acetyltransferase [Desertimonas sp.]